MSTKFLTTSSFQTQKIGKEMAKEVLRAKLGSQAKVFALVGDLGSGKTTFLQGFAKGLGIKETVLSPTFIIMRSLKITGRKNFTLGKFSNFYHVDCYRLKSSKDIISLGLDRILADPKNIVAIEWSTRIEKILPPNTIKIRFKFIDFAKRLIRFNRKLF